MIKNLIFASLLMLLPFFSYSQFKNPPKINVGIAYRPGAIELSNFSSYYTKQHGYIFKGYNYKNNPYLVAEINQKLNRQRWSIQLSNYLTYRYFVTTVDTLNNPIKNFSSLKYDVFFDLLYELRFLKNKQSFFYLGAGIGYMNIGKKFSFQSSYQTDVNGNKLYHTSSTNLSILAPRISIGYANKKLSAWLIAHGTPDNNLESNPTIWAECKLLYSFQIKKKTRN